MIPAGGLVKVLARVRVLDLRARLTPLAWLALLETDRMEVALWRVITVDDIGEWVAMVAACR
jgi:hypothetical protein